MDYMFLITALSIMYDNFQTEVCFFFSFFSWCHLLLIFKFFSYHPSARIFTERAPGYYCSF